MSAIGSFFEAVKEIAIKVPSFDEKRKKQIDEEIEKLEELEFLFENRSIAFESGHSADELLHISDSIRRQKKHIENLFIIYAKELKDA